MQATTDSRFSLSGLMEFARLNGHGLGVSAVLAVTAKFLSEHYGAPAMLMALLLGIAFHFLAEEDGGSCKAGIEFTDAPFCALVLHFWGHGSVSN